MTTSKKVIINAPKSINGKMGSFKKSSSKSIISSFMEDRLGEEGNREAFKRLTQK